MLQQLINHSPDIKRLVDDGYNIEVNGGHLIVHQIPYVNSNREIEYGRIVTALNLPTPTKVSAPFDHTVYFEGKAPCDYQGNILNAIINNSQRYQFGNGIVASHYFSSKPSSGKYSDYYEKIATYAEILCSQARAIDNKVSPRPGHLSEIYSGGNIFKYPDTNSAKAQIEYLNYKFYNQKIAIIGLGGTGSYILDLISKTPVKEIHIYDKDVFQVNNAFRAPGAISAEKFEETGELKKINYYYNIYSQMRNGIYPHDEYITKGNISELSDFDFVFISIDNNETRSMIAQELLQFKISFIDVGLGVNKVDDSLLGSLRVTLSTSNANDHLTQRIGADEIEDNEYKTNIQIAELNCLNAVLAVIKWKKTLGYYQDLKKEHNILYFINTDKLLNEDFIA